ncbi:hypothetical protein VTP01DRAFT_7581 [Rhizomucor pusillus]|uniref:uncharacterized protein n=1 Tax=Rhizomucor pusillus TaxID=4840 RepID=UPI0037447949
MPLRTHAVGAIAPAFTESGKKEKKPSVQAVQKQSFASKLEKIISSESRPIFLSIRASDQFIFATAAIGLFTSTFVHSILFPLSPFIISRINHDNNENVSSTMEATASSPFGGKSSVETSRETGILVALYAVGLLVGSPLFGWLGDKIRQRRIPMLLGISASIAANIMFMFAIAYWMLLLARFLQGVANACVWTMSLCLIADNWPESRLGLQMGKLMGFYPLGLVTGLPVGGGKSIEFEMHKQRFLNREPDV